MSDPMTESPATPPSGAPPRNAPEDRAGEYLGFRLGVEENGIDILRAQEIRSHERPTRLAHSPPNAA